METIVVHPENESQLQALQLILNAFKVPYEKEPCNDDAEYLLSTEANKQWLNTAIKEAENGEGTEIKTGDLWK